MLDIGLYEELTKDLDGFFEKGRRAQTGEIRRYGDSDWKKTSDGWEYVGKNKLYQVNERFNEELQKQINGTLSKGHIYKLGYPGQKLLDAGLRNLPIELSSERLSLKSSKDYKSNHPFELKNIKNLPFALNHPIAVFDSKRNDGVAILTDLKQDKSHFLVAIHLRVSDDERKIEINDIRSVYPKDKIGGIFDWINEGLLKWRDKEKSLKFISSQWPHYIGGRHKLEGLQQKLKEFKNPSVSGGKDTLKKSLEQQFDEFLIQKARISYPIGTIKQFKVGGKMKDYIKTSNGWRPKGKGGTSQSEKEVKQDMSKESLNIKVSDFGEKTLDLYNEAKKDNSLLRNFVDQLINSDFPAKDIFAFIKKEFKLGSKSSDFYEDYLQLKAYWKPHSQEFSDVNEVADWLYKEVYKMTKSKNKFGETLNPNQTKEFIKKFQERYEFDSYSQAEKVLKGLSFNGTKEYSMAFDTNFGQYHFYIGKRDKSEEKKNSEDVEVKEIKAFAIDEFQNRVNAFVKYKGKSYAVSIITPREANKEGYTIHAKELKYLTSGVKKNSERDRAIIQALNRTTYDNFEGIKDDNEVEEKSSNSIKQITQTYVKVDDGQIIIRMNKDKTRYKASKGDFKVESNEGEGIVEFKKRIKEEYEKQSKPKETELEKEIRESLEKGIIIDKIGELLKIGLSEAGLKDVVLKVYDRIRDTSFDKEKDKVFKITQEREYKSYYKENEYNEDREKRDKDNNLQKEVKELLQDIPTEIEGNKGMYADLAFKQLERFHSNRDRESILSVYSGLSEKEKLSLDKKLIEKGYQPIVNGLVYQNYEGNKSYRYFHNYDEDILEFYKADCSLSEEEKKFFKESWTLTGYKYINAINTEKSIDLEKSKELKINVLLDKINDEIKASKISKIIEKSSLSENLVLTRYISLDRSNKEGQDLIFAKEGDVYEDLRFTAFGLSNDNSLPISGDFKITLLAKKGQKVLNIGNEREVEYLCQRGSKFRVLKTGFSSIVVELLDE